MTTIRIKNRDIPMLYTVWEMKQVQEEIAPSSEAVDLVCGVNREDRTDSSRFGSREHLNALTKLIRIMGNAGLEESGQDPDLTDKYVGRGLNPRNLPAIVNTCMDAMAEGMLSEIPPKEDDGPVDVVLEEINKKKEVES